MNDRSNTPEYWNQKWANPKRRVEKYSRQQALWHIQREAAGSVLDVGCGSGRLLYEVKKSIPACDVFGIDFSSVAIGKMKMEYDVDGAVMNIYDLDTLNRTFDCIVINHTLEHLWRDGEVVKKCFDKLYHGGTLFAAVPNSISGPEETEEHVRKYDKNSLRELIKPIFGNCETRMLHHHLIATARKI